MSDEATPRPWRAVSYIDKGARHIVAGAFTEQSPIARPGNPNGLVAYCDMPENAALIVTAVNSFDVLRAACEAALECLEPTDDPKGRTNRVIKQLRSVLNKETGDE